MTGRHWAHGLYISSGGASLIGILFIILGMKRSQSKRWEAPAGGIVGLAAVGARLSYLRWRTIPKEGPKPIVLWEVIAISFYWVAGLAALTLGALAILQVVTAPTGAISRRKSMYDFMLGGVGFTSGLYCFATVSRDLGLGVNHWTFLGLLALSGTAFLLASLFNRATKNSEKKKKRKKKS